MKLYENHEAGRSLIKLLPVCARMDGRVFHNFTKDMERPFYYNMTSLMQDVTKKLVEETNACMGYTQSDEISLAWCADDYKSEIFFNGRIQKMVSTLAALTTLYFNKGIAYYFYPLEIRKYQDKNPTFDARVWNVPNKEEGANVFLWRELDATRNAISMAAQSMFSHIALFEKNCSQMHEMMFQSGVNFNDYPVFFKRGTYFQKKKVMRKFTLTELSNLPEKHEARLNPDLVVERSVVDQVDMPIFSTVLNRAEVIFDGATPIVKAE